MFLNYCWVTGFLFVCLTMPHGLWDLSFRARDWNWALSSEATVFFFLPTSSIWWNCHFWTQNVILRKKSVSFLALMWLPEVLNTHEALVRCLLHSTALTAAKSLQSCPTLCGPTDRSPPGSLSLGFSRQEHWGGLPFPSPTHESEKWKWNCSVMSDSEQP